MIISIIIFVVVLAVLVLVHEFGHFFVARWSGVRVEEFGFGFPPRLVAFKGKVCEWSVNWLPLGGFVKLKGEDGVNNDDDSFAMKPAWKRFLIVVAGPFMNFFLAFVLFSVGYVLGSPEVLDFNMSSHAVVVDKKVEVVGVLDGSLAADLGFLPGDVVVGVSGFSGSDDLSAETISRAIERIYDDGIDGLHFVVERGGKQLDFFAQDIQFDADKPTLGVGMIETGIVSYDVFFAIQKGMMKTISFTHDVVVGFIGFVRGLFVGAGMQGDVAGPVGIAVMTGEVAQLGILYVIQFVALLSVNLAVLNIVPFPALDGGRLLFIVIEMITRKKVDQRFEQMLHIAGFALLLLLVLVVTVRDIATFIG